MIPLNIMLIPKLMPYGELPTLIEVPDIPDKRPEAVHLIYACYQQDTQELCYVGIARHQQHPNDIIPHQYEAARRMLQLWQKKYPYIDAINFASPSDHDQARLWRWLSHLRHYPILRFVGLTDFWNEAMAYIGYAVYCGHDTFNNNPHPRPAYLRALHQLITQASPDIFDITAPHVLTPFFTAENSFARSHNKRLFNKENTLITQEFIQRALDRQLEINGSIQGTLLFNAEEAIPFATLQQQQTLDSKKFRVAIPAEEKDM